MVSRSKIGRFKIIIFFGCFLLLLILFLEIAEQQNSFVKQLLLYASSDVEELYVATIAMKCDESLEVNLNKIQNFVEVIKLNDPQTDLIFFGETITSSYRSNKPGYHKNIAEKIPGKTTDLVAKLARENQVYICFGMAERFGSYVYNTQVLINPKGKIIVKHRKKDVKSIAFESGKRVISIVDIKGFKTGLVICADVQSKAAISEANTHETDLILLSNADWSDSWDTEKLAYKYLAKSYNSWLITANRFGSEADVFWDGHIEIMDPFGEIKTRSELSERYLIYKIKMDPNKAARKWMKIYNNISGIYLILKNLSVFSHYM